MRVLIFGGNGMLGHKVWQEFDSRGFDTWMTIRDSFESIKHFPFFRLEKTIENVEIDDTSRTIIDALSIVQPDVVINCVGIVKQLKEKNSFVVNALFPKYLSYICNARRIRLIHISTDCVFSGKKGGNYKEDDKPDPVDEYGLAKLHGEVIGSNCLTLRTSFVGRELKRKIGLFEWFLSQSGGVVEGYENAIFSGFTTAELASVLVDIVTNHPKLHGLYHISGHTINKYDLLKLINTFLDLGINVMKHSGIHIDRSLNSDKLREILDYKPPSWYGMIQGLCREV